MLLLASRAQGFPPQSPPLPPSLNVVLRSLWLRGDTAPAHVWAQERAQELSTKTINWAHIQTWNKGFPTALLVSHLRVWPAASKSKHLYRDTSPQNSCFSKSRIRVYYLCFKTLFSPKDEGLMSRFINTVPHLEIAWALKISFLSYAACKKWHPHRKLTPWQTPTAPNGVAGLVTKLPKSHTLLQTKMCPEQGAQRGILLL